LKVSPGAAVEMLGGHRVLCGLIADEGEAQAIRRCE
jgi:hypothetical protein